MAGKVNWNIWPASSGPCYDGAKNRQTLNYTQVGDIIHRHPRVMRYVLSRLQDFCKQMRLPPLTGIVINKRSQLPGTGFIAHAIDDIETAFEEVFDYDWSSVPNPFEAFGPDDTQAAFAAALVADPDSAGDVYARVKVRGVVQSVFRRALMTAYDEACAFCGLQFHAALEAAHIKPWAKSSSQERLDPRNGLLLCATHHKLFDDDSLTLTPDRAIAYYTDVEDWAYSEADRAVSALNGAKLRLPADRRLGPRSSTSKNEPTSTGTRSRRRKPKLSLKKLTGATATQPSNCAGICEGVRQSSTSLQRGANTPLFESTFYAARQSTPHTSTFARSARCPG